MKKRTKRI